MLLLLLLLDLTAAYLLLLGHFDDKAFIAAIITLMCYCYYCTVAIIVINLQEYLKPIANNMQIDIAADLMMSIAMLAPESEKAKEVDCAFHSWLWCYYYDSHISSSCFFLFCVPIVIAIWLVLKVKALTISSNLFNVYSIRILLKTVWKIRTTFKLIKNKLMHVSK